MRGRITPALHDDTWTAVRVPYIGYSSFFTSFLVRYVWVSKGLRHHLHPARRGGVLNSSNHRVRRPLVDKVPRQRGVGYVVEKHVER